MAANDDTCFRMIPGGGDMIDVLEGALEQVRLGSLEGVVVCGISKGETSGWTWAHKDGIVAPWPRFVTIVGLAHHELLRDGLEVKG